MQLKGRSKRVTESLLECIRERHPHETLLLTLLLQEARDYEGICDTLSTKAVVADIDTTGGIFNVVARLRTAAEIAREDHKTDDLAMWTLNIATAKAFVSHAVSSVEIKALLSIGETQDALKKAYAIPEPSIKIRLLARAYTAMKESGDRVSKRALDELTTMARSLDLTSLDEEIAQEVAIDLFPILPDLAFSLLERSVGQSEKRTIIEVAIEAVEENFQESWEGVHLLDSEEQGDPTYITQLLSSWLNNISLPELRSELRSVENTKAKEYIIRQWCRQNKENCDIAEAIDLWLDTVVGDSTFVVLLRSLRHISEAVVGVPIAKRELLIDRLRAQGFMALDSPKEEWVRFRLNLAEALSAIDREASEAEIKQVHQSIRESTLDLDVQVFCLARLWATVTKVFPERLNWINDVHIQFQGAFSTLLSDSAEQREAIIGTLRTLADIDPVSALTEALDLNTHMRRVRAIREVIGYTLRRHGSHDVTDFLEDALQSLTEKSEREAVLVSVASELDAREVVLDLSNLEVLLKHSRDIASPRQKVQALSSLVSLFRHASQNDVSDILKEAVEAWRRVGDLRVKLSLGFTLVKKTSKLDIDQAKQLYDEVRDMKYQPGSALAIGSLGSIYRHNLDLAIRAITLKDLSESDQVLSSLEDLIARIPSPLVQVHLLAELAASAYRVGYSECADDLVRTKVIRRIEQMRSDPNQAHSRPDFIAALEFCLPVIFEYDFSTAKELSFELPYPIKDRAWCSTVFWSLCRSFLGDHKHEPKDLRVKVDHPRFNTTLAAAREIDCDGLLYEAIKAITSTVRASFDSEIDLIQAVDVLEQLENLAASKLPEPSQKNIKHEGYLVLAEALIHGARSDVYHRAKKHQQRLNPKDISHRWIEIRNRAEAIPNVADRVFVMTLIAPEMALYYRKNLSSVRDLLEKAESQIVDIPTLIDRIDRLEVLADSWISLGNKEDKSKAEVILKYAFDLARQLEAASSDDRLRILVQAAYKMKPELANHMVSTLDARLPREMAHSTNLTLGIEELRSMPSRIDQLQARGQLQDDILSSTAKKLLEDFAANRTSVASKSVLESWLANANRCAPRTIIDVMHWVVESLYRKAPSSSQSRYDVFTKSALLIQELAKWISAKRGEGIPEAIYDSFPGLSTKVVVFRAGEAERAKAWLQNWLLENVESYLKICDPYFGIEEIEYLMHIPADCRTLIVTTDQYLDVSDGSPDQVKVELEGHWHRTTSQALPHVQFLIVPKRLEDTFHDRAIITQDAGLDVGPSLNRLGEKFQKITVLSGEDARELEETYIDKMLNNATWFMEGIHPVVLWLGN